VTTETVADPVQKRYADALASLTDKVRQDPYVLALILLGSLSHDVVWDKSDIDLLLVTQETRQQMPGLTLVEDGIVIHAQRVPRSEFKRMAEGAVRGSFVHSLLRKGRIIFTRDETLEALWEGRARVGARDREVRLLEAAVWPLMALPKAQKWLSVKGDRHYAFLWITKCLDGLAAIEVTLAGEVPGREALAQALPLNPAFFRAVYTDLIDGPKTEETLGRALREIEDYLRARIPALFEPILTFLAESGGVRAAHDIEHHFRTHFNVSSADLACEWLAEQGVITQVAAPVRLTDRSRVDVEEAAYYYDGAPS